MIGEEKGGEGRKANVYGQVSGKGSEEVIYDWIEVSGERKGGANCLGRDRSGWRKEGWSES